MGRPVAKVQTGKYDSTAKDEPGGDTLALTAKVARLNKGMLQFDEKPGDVVILGQTLNGKRS